jgi:hypothetical protein
MVILHLTPSSIESGRKAIEGRNFFVLGYTGKLKKIGPYKKNAFFPEPYS